MRDVLLIISCLVLLLLQIASQPVVELTDTLLSESCSVEFPNNVRWYSSRLGVAAGEEFISRVDGCQLTKTLEVTGTIESVLVVDSTLLFCLSGNLYLTSPTLQEITLIESNSPFFAATPMCSHHVNQKIHYQYIAPAIHYTTYGYNERQDKMTKINLSTGARVENSNSWRIDVGDVLETFKHGDFVFTVYTTPEGNGRISRICANDNGSHGNFRTFRFGTLSCKTDQLAHPRLLAVHHTDTSLHLLTSRDPLELSGRVLCTLDMEIVNRQFDTGLFLDYDESGSETRTSGNEIDCSNPNQISYLTQLTEDISSSDNVVQKQAGFSEFMLLQRASSIFWYLAQDDRVEVRTDENGFVDLLQTIVLPNQVKEIQVEQGMLHVVGGTSLTVLQPYICSYIKDPIKCYSSTAPPCSWNSENWTCLPVTVKRHFSDDHPDGVLKEAVVDSGCTRVATVYKESGVSTFTDSVDCSAPKLDSSLILINSDSSCLGKHRIACASGYKLASGDTERQCLPSGKWSGSSPVCQEIRCGPLVPSPGSTISTNSTRAGTLVYVRCSHSCQEPTSRTPIECQESGSWNGTLPACAYKTCYPLPLPVNSVLVYGERQPVCGSKFVVECSTGTSLVMGNKVRSCTPRGTWDGSLPYCTVTHCDPFPVPGPSRTTPTMNRVGDVVTVTCDVCHKAVVSDDTGEVATRGHVTTVSSLCLSSGAWTKSVTCEPVSCPVLKPTSGASMKLMNSTCFGIAEFECKSGFRISDGDLVRHCQTDGKWSGSMPLCVPISCPFLALNPNTETISSGKNVGDKAVFSCREDHYLKHGSLELHCLPSGDWSGRVPVCASVSELIPAPDEEIAEIRPVTVAPAAVSREYQPEDSNGLVALAVTGWLLFALALVAIFTLLLVLRKGNFERMDKLAVLGIAGKLFSLKNFGSGQSFDRQLTQTTTVGTLERPKTVIVGEIT